MSITDFIVSSEILECSESSRKTEVVQQLLHRLAADGHLDPGCVPSVFDGVMRRESLGSTGIGRGVAIPPTRNIQPLPDGSAFSDCAAPPSISTALMLNQSTSSS